MAATVAAAWTADNAQADNGPAPLFLAPRAASEVSLTDTSDVEAASRERLKERAAAVSNPNLKWKPYRPAPKPDAKPTIEKPTAAESGAAGSTTRPDAPKASARRRTATKASAAKSAAKAPRQASKIATEADNGPSAVADAVAETTVEAEAVADAAPARRTPAREPRSRLRSEILQVDQREKPEPYSDPFENNPSPTPMDRGPTPAPNGADTETPRTISPGEDSFPEEALPMPSEIGGGNYESSAPAANEGVGCDSDKAQCLKDLKRLKSTTIDKININIAVSGTEGTDFPCECELTGVFTDRNWQTTLYTWKASALCHKPLYFEEVALERYGHSLNPLLQPVFSGVHFFATIPILPYMMGVYPPNECQYVLGYYRMGDCSPYMVPPFPFSLRGAFFEAVGVVCPILIVH